MKLINELTAAQIGLNALIDEATGYQAQRSKDVLKKMARGKRKSETISPEWAKEQITIRRQRIREIGNNRAHKSN